jgi:hypothetical protein
MVQSLGCGKLAPLRNGGVIFTAATLTVQNLEM